MIVYIDDILLMADTAAQVEGQLKALTFLLTGLGFIIKCAKVYHYPNPTDRVPGPEGGLSVPTLKSTGRETSPYKDGGQTTFAEATGDGTATGPEGQCFQVTLHLSCCVCHQQNIIYIDYHSHPLARRKITTGFITLVNTYGAHDRANERHVN